MASSVQLKVRGRAAHPPGPTFLAYTPDGSRLITAGSNNVIRVYETGSDGEPTNIDDCPENNLAVAATDNSFVAGTEDGTVCLYSLRTNEYDKMLTRCTVPIRDLAISPDQQWLAVASDELTVKIINIEDPLRVMYLRNCRKSPKHVVFHPSGSYISVSCIDGIVYIYSISTSEPELVRKIEGVARTLDADVEASSRAIWHPDGRAVGIPTSTRDIQLVSRTDGEKQKTFTGAHLGDITAHAWSPNGALLATAAVDGKIILWDNSTQKPTARYDYGNVTNLAWHPSSNIVSFTTSDGEVYICPDFVREEDSRVLGEPIQPAPFLYDPLTESNGNARKVVVNGTKPAAVVRHEREGTLDSLDDILGSDLAADEDDFVVDDDGAGYALNRNGKRSMHQFDETDVVAKRHAGPDIWQPRIHESIQPGSTPWRGNRRYLALNLVGFVWTVNQEEHHTVTVEFYDRELHRDFHFTDMHRYDKACLNESGALFSAPPNDDSAATIYYRPHETWTARADWRTELPDGERVTAIALSDSYIVVSTTSNYVRLYTLFGTPIRIYRQKSSPAVTCAAWRDYVLTIGNGPVGSSGATMLTYTIENVRRGETHQDGDIVAIPEGNSLVSVFFSDNGDPCIYDSQGVLLVLQRWRTSGQAKWVPLLDTKQLERLASGRKEEAYWPVAVAQEKFHCIILKGGDLYPYFPRPLLSEFPFSIPLGKRLLNSTADVDGDASGMPSTSEGGKLEEAFVSASLQHDLMADMVESTHATRTQRTELSRRELEVDKALLQLLNAECQAGEEHGMKALELVDLFRDRTGRMLEAACKVASRYGRNVLEDKIREVAERRLAGEDEDKF